jgi:hypothetical protein
MAALYTSGITTIDTEYTVLETDHIIRCEAGNYRVYLPKNAGSGRRIIIKKVSDDSTTIIVVTGRGNTIDYEWDDSTQLNLGGSFEMIELLDGGEDNWDIIGHYKRDHIA